MTTQEEKFKKESRIILGILAAVFAGLMIIFITSCVSKKSAVPYHQGLQRELTFDNAVNNLETFSIKSAKEDNSELKKKIKEAEKQNSENAKRKSIEDKNAELRAKLEEIKNNNK